MKVVSNFSCQGGRGSHDVAVKDNIAYICGYWNFTLYAVDLTTIKKPKLISKLFSWDLVGIHDIAIYKNRAYITNCHKDCITSIDISDPSNMRIVSKRGDSRFLDYVHALYVTKDYIFTGSHRADYFTILDRRKMQIISSIHLGVRPRGIDLKGNLCLVSSPDGYLVTIDITNPSSPTISDRIPICSRKVKKLNEASYVKHRGNIAYVSLGKNQSLNSINLDSLKVLSSVHAESANYICIYRKNAYISGCKSAKAITKINISNPEDLKVINKLVYKKLYFASGLAIYKNYLLCCPRDGLTNLLTIVEQ